jgi:hypothetical protein
MTVSSFRTNDRQVCHRRFFLKKKKMSNRSSNPANTMTMGEGAIVTVLAKFLHPKQQVSKLFPNMNPIKRLGACSHCSL